MMKTIKRASLRLTCLTLAFIHGFVALTPQAHGQSQTSGAGSKSETSYALVPVTALKDKSKKSVIWEVADTNGEKAYMEFKDDPSERKDISTLRFEMNAQEKEVKRQVDFIRHFLSLPENFYKNYIPKNADIHWLKRELANDYFVLEYYHRLPREFQNEIYRQYGLKSQGYAKIAFNAFARPFSTSIHGFPAQTVLFSVVLGAMVYKQLMFDYHSNPLGMLHQIETMKDPIANFSFYTFMGFSGLTTDVISKHYQGTPRMTQSLRVAMPYIGMFGGMLFSSLTAEVVQTLSVCAKSIMGASAQDNFLKQMAQATGNGKKADPCDEAQKQFFNFENKVEQYLPMIISLGLSVKGASFVQTHVGTAGKLAGKVGSYIAATPYGKKLAAKTVFQMAKAGAAKVISVKGVIAAARITPAGWIFNGITIGAATSALLQTAGFLMIDHAIMPVITKAWAQIWRAGLVNRTDENLKKSFELMQTQNWKFDSTNMKCNSMKEYFDKECDSNLNFFTQIEDLGNQMTMWRAQNHSRFFTGILSWTQITTKLIQELAAAEKFYSFYATELFKSFNQQVKRNSSAGIQGSDVYLGQNLPFRQAPLYGVRPRGHAECVDTSDILDAEKKKQIEEDNKTCATETSLYLNYPDQMEKFQMNQINYIVDRLTPYLSFGNMEKRADKELQNKLYKERLKKFETLKAIKTEDEEEQEKIADEARQLVLESKIAGAVNSISKETFVFISTLLGQLKSEDKKQIAIALLNLNKEIDRLSDPVLNTKRADSDGLKLLTFIRSNLGDPNPMLGQGMLIPYAYTTQNQKSFEQLKNKNKNGYQFSRYPEYLLYQMVCGPEEGSKNILSESLGFEPEFNPPRLVTAKKIEVQWPENYQLNGPKRTSLCLPVTSKVVPFSQLYVSKIFIDGKQDPISFMNLINSTVNMELIGNYKNLEVNAKSGFPQWWDKTITDGVRKLFSRLDNEYQFLLAELAEGLSSDKEKAANNSLPNKNTLAATSLLESHQQELNVHLLVLAEIEKSLSADKKSVKFENGKKSILDIMNRPPTTDLNSQKEFVAALNDVINLLKGVKVVKDSNNKKRAQLPQFEIPVGKTVEKAEESLVAYKKEFDGLPLDAYQKQLAGSSIEAIEKGLQSLTGYLLNTLLTNYSAIENYDSYLATMNKSDKSAPTVKKGSTPWAN